MIRLMVVCYGSQRRHVKRKFLRIWLRSISWRPFARRVPHRSSDHLACVACVVCRVVEKRVQPKELPYRT